MQQPNELRMFYWRPIWGNAQSHHPEQSRSFVLDIIFKESLIEDLGVETKKRVM